MLSLVEYYKILWGHLISNSSEEDDSEDPDEYRAVNVFWVPPEARWLKAQERHIQFISQFLSTQRFKSVSGLTDVKEKLNENRNTKKTYN